MKHLAESMIKMATELTPELSRGPIKLDHKDVLELLCACAQIEVQQRIYRELQVLTHEKRMEQNPLSLMNMHYGNAEEEKDDD